MEVVLDKASRPALETELLAAGVDQVEAIGGDAKEAEIEERRRTALLQIEDGALHYLQLSARVARRRSVLGHA